MRGAAQPEDDAFGADTPDAMTDDLIQFGFHAQFGGAPTIVARAPGRVEFIGNHLDYNGGCVIGAAIDRYVWVAARPTSSGTIRIVSQGRRQRVECFTPAPQKFKGAFAWANYPLGVWLALEEFGLRRPASFDLMIFSNVPSGAGLSSSAALELATALALHGLVTDETLGPARLATLGRHAENRHVGVPCGILDQGTSAFGAADRLVHIDCRASRFQQLAVPAGLRLWVFDSAEKHSLVDGLYATRHEECQRARKVAQVQWLTDVDPADVTDLLGRMDPALGGRLAHVVQEQARVLETVAALERGDLPRVGECLFASHWSSSRLFENSTPNLDALVSALAVTPGVIGARLTGGGFGGAVMALTSEEFVEERAEILAEQHVARGFLRPREFRLRLADGARVLSPPVPSGYVGEQLA